QKLKDLPGTSAIWVVRGSRSFSPNFIVARGLPPVQPINKIGKELVSSSERIPLLIIRDGA
ncbi:MAG: hypothetical protein AB8B32_09545, partial [Prochlorococcus sp.]